MAPKKDGPKKTINVANTKEDKQQAIDAAIAAIEKKFGLGSVMFLGGEKASRLNVEAISTGSLTLDLALGIGGLPKGRIVEIYGPESGGKTTVSLHCVAETQKLGGTAAFIDVEHALDPLYARNLGVDINKLLVSQPDTGEQALEIMETMARSGAIDLIVLDSVAAMVTSAEIEGNMGDAYVGVQARLMSASLRKLTSVISKTNTIAIFINQIREKIGGYNPTGNPAETTPGGRALKFYSSVRIDVRRSEQIKEDGEVIGYRTKCNVKKNKVAPPFRIAEFDMIFGKGIHKLGEIIDIATQLEVLRKGGAWYYFGETRLGQGREQVKKFLGEDKKLMEEIEAQVREKHKNATSSVDITETVIINDDKTADTVESGADSAADKAADKTESDVKTEISSGKKSVKAKTVKPVTDDFEEFSPDEL
jgi:recombination protein RecA